MTIKTTEAKITGKTQYISPTVYKGTRTRSGAAAELYRTQALASLSRISAKVAVEVRVALYALLAGFIAGAVVVEIKNDPPRFTHAGFNQIASQHSIGP